MQQSVENRTAGRIMRHAMGAAEDQLGDENFMRSKKGTSPTKSPRSKSRKSVRIAEGEDFGKENRPMFGAGAVGASSE